MKWTDDQTKYKQNDRHLPQLNAYIKTEYGKKEFITGQANFI